MGKYMIRLDDAAERRDKEKWDRMEALLDRYAVSPLVGIIPDCRDRDFLIYERDPLFWDKAVMWKKKGWEIALHGFDHVCITNQGGLNPVHHRSEFAGLPLIEQQKKIRRGMLILKEHGITPNVFFAPSHTFDENTLTALKKESNIRIISDTVATDSYRKGEFTFVPQQSGRVRKLPFSKVTFCYHPNTMSDSSFEELERFLKKYSGFFIKFPTDFSHRRKNMLDHFISKLYFIRK